VRTELGLFIDGKWEAASDGATTRDINPATEEEWGTFASATVADVDRAIGAAKRAHASGVWRDKPREERSAILMAAGMRILERMDELAQTEVFDAGGTMRKAQLADVPTAAQTFMHYAELLAATPEEEEHSSEVPAPSRNIIRSEPLGVCACIVPFNFPMCAASWKIAPALAAGNTVVLKPSPYTPATALLLAEICHEVGVPDGVLNVITSPSPEVGEAMVAHPDVAKVSFTGSTKVGRRVAEVAARGLKKVTLELGGKSPNIILDDAALDGAVRGALFGTFFHSGQICESGTRVLVHESLHERFLEKLVAGAKALRLGDTMDMDTQMGPLVSAQQLANTQRYVALGKEEGAECVLGGERPAHLPKGYYHLPTIFTKVKNGMRIAQEEIFGPVVSVLTFRDDDEALRIANDTMYGLGGAVWSKNLERARAMANRLESGTVWINDYHLINLRFPFGGYKQSGIGRELGTWGLADFQQLKHIHVGVAEDEKMYASILLD
jgi:acyl-CoA reductase-like NAD-dependent aldehyde dehydrogenase